MALRVRSLAILSEDPGSIPAPLVATQLSVTPGVSMSLRVLGLQVKHPHTEK